MANLTVTKLTIVHRMTLEGEALNARLALTRIVTLLRRTCSEQCWIPATSYAQSAVTP